MITHGPVEPAGAHLAAEVFCGEPGPAQRVYFPSRSWSALWLSRDLMLLALKLPEMFLGM